MHIAQNTLREKYLSTISLLVDNSPESYTRELMLDADQLNFFLNDRARAQEIVKAVALEDREREKELQEKAKKSKTVTAQPAAQKPGPPSPKDVPKELPKVPEKPDEIIMENPQEKKTPAKTQSTLFDGF
jgi:replication factor C large subunit